jgi:hypothetical protein
VATPDSYHSIRNLLFEKMAHTGGEIMTTSIHTELPDRLVAQAQTLVHDGWAADFDELLADALARYLESHTAELSEAFLREDVQWGLRGKD